MMEMFKEVVCDKETRWAAVVFSAFFLTLLFGGAL
ncbi:Uncharacterised protein [[Flavobacterium] thermophilum]|nr:Uncharacterised protein [[Flavobacterium] thermophilum]